MACSVPFNKKSLDISFFVFKPTVVIIDDLVHGLKQFSLSTESLGCVQSSIFRSIHGNMIIWCGAWQKRSSKEKELLTSTLVSLEKFENSYSSVILHIDGIKLDIKAVSFSLTCFRMKSYLVSVSEPISVVSPILADICGGIVGRRPTSFLEAYAGETRDSSSAAKFSTGDIISINSADTTNSSDLSDLCYAVLALFRSRFAKMEGITSGLCLKGQSRPIVVCIHVWKSLQFCYSWILNSDHRKWMMPYLERFSIDMKYDIFRVVYVSDDIDNVVDLNCNSPHQMLENGKESRQGQVMQN